MVGTDSSAIENKYGVALPLCRVSSLLSFLKVSRAGGTGRSKIKILLLCGYVSPKSMTVYNLLCIYDRMYLEVQVLDRSVTVFCF